MPLNFVRSVPFVLTGFPSVAQPGSSRVRFPPAGAVAAAGVCGYGGGGAGVCVWRCGGVEV